MKLPKLANNPRAAKIVAALSEILVVRELQTEDDLLVLGLRAIPARSNGRNRPPAQLRVRLEVSPIFSPPFHPDISVEVLAMSQLLTLQQQGRVAIVTLCRPPANALNHAFMAELCTLLPRLRSPEIGAVILTAEGRFFSAGLDLFEVFSYSPEQGAAFATAFDDAITGFFALPMPLIAAINGHAVAGGTVLAATADFPADCGRRSQDGAD
jgi:hypothetical protein